MTPDHLEALWYQPGSNEEPVATADPWMVESSPEKIHLHWASAVSQESPLSAHHCRKLSLSAPVIWTRPSDIVPYPSSASSVGSNPLSAFMLPMTAAMAGVVKPCWAR